MCSSDLETEARLRIDRETLEIEKRKNALAEMDKKHEAKTEGDRWSKLGWSDKLPAMAAIFSPRPALTLGGVEKIISSKEAEIAKIDEQGNDFGEEQTLIRLRRKAELQRDIASLRRSNPTLRTEDDPSFVGPRREVGSPTENFIGPLEDFEDYLRRMQGTIIGSTAPTGSTAIAPSVAGDSEQSREVITKLDTSNTTQREMATLLRRMADSLA